MTACPLECSIRYRGDMRMLCVQRYRAAHNDSNECVICQFGYITVYANFTDLRDKDGTE